ncbi:MAG TPA: hypothetical protein VEK08_06895 [Planctomycetota bacterium]|nr:hypothetical protein [Planctomycetota bacterium]
MSDDLLNPETDIYEAAFGTLENIRLQHGELTLILRIDQLTTDCDENQHTWELRCSNPLRYRFVDENFLPIYVRDNHPLIWAEIEPRQELYFHGRPENADAMIGALYQAHQQITQGWIPFNNYLNPCMPLKKLLSGTCGLIADGPVRIIDVYEAAFKQHGVKTNRLKERPAKRWNGNAWVPHSGSLRALLLGESYVLCEKINAERILN